MFPQGSPADPPLASQTRPAPFRGRAGFLRLSRGFLRQAAALKKRHFPPESAPRRKRRPCAARLPGAEKPPPSRRAIARGPEGRRPRAARFQEGCRHVRQPCAGRFRETKGRRPRAAQLPGGRKAVALAPRASRKVAGMSASLARGASQETEGRRPCAARFPGAERPSPSRHTIAQGRKAAALAPHDCPGAGNRRPRAAQMPGGRKAVALAPALPGGRGRTGCVHSPFAPAWDAAPGMGGA